MPKTRRSKSEGSKSKGSKSKGTRSKGPRRKINNQSNCLTRKNLHLKHDMKKRKPMKGGFGVPSPLINMYHGAGYFFGNIYTTLIGVPGNAHFLPTMGQYASSLAI